jgi:toxin ParE1/3/4
MPAHRCDTRDRQAARRGISTAVEEKCRLIAVTPHIGRARDDLTPELRSFAVGNYVILYRVREDGIEVVRVLHAARDIPEFF